MDDDLLFVLSSRQHRQLLSLQHFLAHPVSARFRYVIDADDLGAEVDAVLEALVLVLGKLRPTCNVSR